jgi:hypothetical protein
LRKMCHVLNLDGPIMVPRIYTHRAEHDLYFPEVCLCATFLFIKVVLNVACITYCISNLADPKVQEIEIM